MEAEGSQARVLGSFRERFALVNMKFAGVHRAKFAAGSLDNRVAQLRRNERLLEACQREVRREGPLVRWDANPLERGFHIGGKGREIRRGAHRGPEDARFIFVREESEPAKLESNGGH